MIDHVFDPNAPTASGQDAPDQDDGPDAPGDGERIAKALARAGVASRREVERLISAGRVALNGRVLDTPAIKIGPGDVLSVDGAVVAAPEPARVWRYHKPAGLVTTHKDPKDRPTVFDHLPKGLPRVISVGRLDLNTEGLLLLTNDGALARALELPATGLARRYRARARGRATQARLDMLKDGLTVDGVHYGPIEATLDKAKEGSTASNLWITLSLREGKNREVRKVLEALGLTVNRLVRLSYGPFQLGTLELGGVEEVGPRVIREQLGEHIAPENLPTGNTLAVSAVPLSRAAGKAAGGARRRGILADGVETPKTVYKPGWAKPKKRVVHAKSKRRPAADKDPAASAYSAGKRPLDKHPSGKRPPAKRPKSAAPPKAAPRPARGSGAHRRGRPADDVGKDVKPRR